MAEKYTIGLVRLWYKATGFKEGLNVTADLIKPDLTKEIGITFTEAGEGMYFVNYNFKHTGSYVSIMFENGDKKVSQNFNIVRRSGFGGKNLLNN